MKNLLLMFTIIPFMCSAELSDVYGPLAELAKRLDKLEVNVQDLDSRIDRVMRDIARWINTNESGIGDKRVDALEKQVAELAKKNNDLRVPQAFVFTWAKRGMGFTTNTSGIVFNQNVPHDFLDNYAAILKELLGSHIVSISVSPSPYWIDIELQDMTEDGLKKVIERANARIRAQLK